MTKRRAFIIATTVLGVATAVATTSFDRVNALKDELKLHHVDGKKEEAAQLATKLAANPSNEPFVQGPLQEELSALDATVTNTSLDKAVNFITGKKTEMYCEGQGLVEMSGEHSDGSTSHIALVRSNRIMAAGSFSQVEGGDWSYDFTTSFRRPSISEFVMVNGSPTSFHLKEVRNKANGKTDSGEVKMNWSTGKMTGSYHSTGDGPEPLPNYMAIDYHGWGNKDLGYKIKFEPGFKDTQETMEQSSTKDIILSSERTVGDFVPEVSVKDSKGEVRQYMNCYPVKYNVTLKRIEDRQLVVDGQVNKDTVRRSLKKYRKQVRACYDHALEVDPSLKGTVTLSWDVNDKGRVTEAKPVSRNLTGDGELETREAMIQCMLDKVKTWKFSAAPKGQDVHITSPFTIRE